MLGDLAAGFEDGSLRSFRDVAGLGLDKALMWKANLMLHYSCEITPFITRWTTPSAVLGVPVYVDVEYCMALRNTIGEQKKWHHFRWLLFWKVGKGNFLKWERRKNKAIWVLLATVQMFCRSSQPSLLEDTHGTSSLSLGKACINKHVIF